SLNSCVTHVLDSYRPAGRRLFIRRRPAVLEVGRHARELAGRGRVRFRSLASPRSRHPSLLRDGIADPPSGRVPIPASCLPALSLLGAPPTAEKQKRHACALR